MNFSEVHGIITKYKKRYSDMSNKNIINQFKITLGQYCAINQFVELSKRGFLSEHKDIISDREKFIEYANVHQVTLTEYSAEKMDRLISLSYIANVHLCFESFLNALLSHMRKYGMTTVSEKTKEDSWLVCVWKNLPYDKNENMQQLFDICEYYRLVRNKAVHSLSEDKTCKVAFSKLSQYTFATDTKFCKLSAPSSFEEINFDDFVLFARSTNELAISLYSNFQYDYDKLVIDILSQCKSKINKYQNNPKRIKDFLRSHIVTYYKDSDVLVETIEKHFNKQG